MSEYENCIGKSDEWFTPPEIFDALGLIFDLDVASPGPDHWVPARKVFVARPLRRPPPTNDGPAQIVGGLDSPWNGMVWMNPPFGGRNGQVPWLKKFIQHGNGVALVAARTSAGWFHDILPNADGLLFPRGKTKFIRPDGSVGGSPGTGIVLVSMGRVASTALENSELGMFWDRRHARLNPSNHHQTRERNDP